MFCIAGQMPGLDVLGEFEQIVLLAIAHLDGDAYGVTIRRAIEDRIGRAVSVGALYTALDRLEAKGLLRSRVSEPTPQRGGRARRFVDLTPAGIAALNRTRALMTRMWAGLPDGAIPTRRRLQPKRGPS
jgi:PadR family transcriptional regulator, regulatory protein PadR